VWRGIVVIESAYRTEDPGFESLQGVRFLGVYIHCSAVAICIVSLYLRKLNSSKSTLIYCNDSVVVVNAAVVRCASFCVLKIRVARCFFSNQKFKFVQILEGLRWENVDIFLGHLEYFMDIWDIL
jgi:hypothetical protein